MTLTLDIAEKIISAAKKKATKMKGSMYICFGDACANLGDVVRMDGAWLGSAESSLKKAKTARCFDMNSGEIGNLSQPGGPLYNIEHSNGGLISFPGGITS